MVTLNFSTKINKIDNQYDESKNTAFKNMLRLSVNIRVSLIISYFKSSMSTTSKELNQSVDLTDLRIPYNSEEVEQDFTEKDPLKLFDTWFAVARSTDGIREANAMALATADVSGKPSVRYVLLKGYGKDGFTFFTNYESRKGQEMAENPNVSLLFYWETLCRQIRIEGSVSKVDERESEEYFHSRPRSSQISAVVSNQSTVIESKEILLKKQYNLEQQYADTNALIPKPTYWGGYRVIPKSFEFWCGRTNRLHDRLRFRLPAPQEVPDEKFSFSGENGWIYEYLSP